MTITRDNLAAHELAGLPVKVDASSDPTLRGLSGIVRDETRNTIRVEVAKGLVTIPKDKSSLSFRLPGGEWAGVEGSKLRFRPEDRVKKGIVKW